MSVPSSTILPRSDPISGDDGRCDFDGAAEILRAWGAGLTPDPDLTVSEWADRHRMLSGRASAEPGRYRTARTPYMGEIMDRLSPGDRDPADRLHEGCSGRRDGSWKQLDWIRDPPGAGADAGGPADGGTGETQLAPADRSADRREPGTAGAGQTGALARRRQHDAVEGIRGRHPDHDRARTRRSGCARPRRATSSSTRSTPIRPRPTRKAIR